MAVWRRMDSVCLPAEHVFALTADKIRKRLVELQQFRPALCGKLTAGCGKSREPLRVAARAPLRRVEVAVLVVWSGRHHDEPLARGLRTVGDLRHVTAECLKALPAPSLYLFIYFDSRTVVAVPDVVHAEHHKYSVRTLRQHVGFPARCPTARRAAADAAVHKASSAPREAQVPEQLEIHVVEAAMRYGVAEERDALAWRERSHRRRRGVGGGTWRQAREHGHGEKDCTPRDHFSAHSGHAAPASGSSREAIQSALGGRDGNTMRPAAV